jgi:hypothetical protein
LFGAKGRFSIMATRKLWLAAVALFLAASGCGGPRLVKVTGKLTFKGQPVPNTRVFFTPDEEGQRGSSGVTDDEGRFTLKNSRTTDGALRGQHTVYLRYEPTAEEELGTSPAKVSRDVKEILGKYARGKSSDLHYDITSDGQFVEIDLK